MTLILDAGPLIALADQADPYREQVARVLDEEREALVIPSPVTAEIDYLLGERLGERPRTAFLEDLAEERFVVECLQPDEYRVIADLDRRYSALRPGLADLSLVVVAQRARTRRLLTFDERHFRTIRPLQGGAFTLLPADA